MIVHTWADADPYMTLCGEVIRAGILSTANQHGVTCPACRAAFFGTKRKDSVGD